MSAPDPPASDKRDQEPKELPEPDKEWLRRFFWYRGLLAQEIVGAINQVRLLVQDDVRPETIRRAALTVIRALNELTTRREWLRREALRKSASPDTAEELTQMVIAKALESRSSLMLLGSWYATDESLQEHKAKTDWWLRRMLLQLWIDRHRGVTPPLSLDLILADGTPLHEYIASPTDFTTELYDADVLGAIRRFLDLAEASPQTFTLHVRDVRIARARWFTNAKVQEIARVEQISTATVDAAVKRVRVRLKDWLERSKLMDIPP